VNNMITKVFIIKFPDNMSLIADQFEIEINKAIVKQLEDLDIYGKGNNRL